MSEVSLSQVEDQVDDYSDGEEEAPVFLDLTGMRPGKDLEGDAGAGLDSALESTIGAQEWRLEVERVLPSLKIHVRQDNRVSLCYDNPLECGPSKYCCFPEPRSWLHASLK